MHFLKYQFSEHADINECQGNGTNICSNLSETCENTEGSYKCICLPGFRKDNTLCQGIPSLLVFFCNLLYIFVYDNTCYVKYFTKLFHFCAIDDQQIKNQMRCFFFLLMIQ